mgnify:CR=1 FL=1
MAFFGLSKDEENGKLACFAYVPETLEQEGVNADQWVSEALRACNGKGGGKGVMAVGSSTHLELAGEALIAAQAYASKQ